MKHSFGFVLSFLLALGSLQAQASTHTVSGYITDAQSGETLISASAFDALSRKGTVSNTYGFYSLTLGGDMAELTFSYVGYQPQQVSLHLQKDTLIHIRLQPATELSEVVVTGSQDFNPVKSAQMSVIDVPIAQIKSIPALFGETDVLKSIQLLPGVKAGTEGTSGMYVRGGGPDENLFLLDGVPIYNVNHMGGFFSIFNSDAIKNVTLYKGDFPARFSGRLSSVVDIRMKDGDNQKIHGNVSVGLVSSNLNLEGPLWSGNTTFNLSARRTYLDLLLKPVVNLLVNGNGERFSGGYYFYDLNAKLSHKFSDTDRLYLSYYGGDDVFQSEISTYETNPDNSTFMSAADIGLKWGNAIAALRWNHMLNQKLFVNTTATYSRYRFTIHTGLESEYHSDTEHSTGNMQLSYFSGIEDFALKADFDYNPTPVHAIKFGVNYTFHVFKPGVQSYFMEAKFNSKEERQDTTVGNYNVYSNEGILYAEDNITVTPYFKTNIGLNLSNYLVEGKYYPSIQPRVSARLLFSDQLSLKAGYAYMNQYIHLLSNNNISLPTDLWVPVTKRIDPMNSHQISTGLFYELTQIADLSVEAYYKAMNNLIEYKDGASYMNSGTDWQNKVCMGKGRSYGIEFLAQRSVGPVTGWIGYTFAHATRTFDRPGEQLNQGRSFPARYDRRHDLSIVLSHKFSERFDLAGTWVFSTGNAATLSTQQYAASSEALGNNGPVTLNYIESRNNFRYPDYQRVDVGVNFHKQKKHGVRTWNISVYNVLNHKNPFFVYSTESFSELEMMNKKALKQFTLFTILPSVSYSYKF